VDLTTTLTGSYSIAKKRNALASWLRKAGEDDRALDLLSCWQKLSMEKQEIILDVVRGMQAAAAVSSSVAMAGCAGLQAPSGPCHRLG
jgi:hypothetical protein